MEQLIKLALGTAQFGMPYGAMNIKGIVAEADVSRIFDLAANSAVSILDTAAGYGDSEQRIGRLARARFGVVSKLMPIDLNRSNPLKSVASQFHDSLRKLDARKVYGLLCHGAGDLLGKCGDGLFDLMQNFRAEGKAERLGVSVYSPEEAEILMGRFPIDLIQIPTSIWDQRFLQDGLLNRLSDRGIEIHARSVFLQGVLIASRDHLSLVPGCVKIELEKFIERAEKVGINRIELALAFVKRLPIDHVIVGTTSVAEFCQLIDVWNNQKIFDIDWESFSIADNKIVDPREWRAANR